MDRAWRYYPSLRPVLAHPYARLLMRQGWDWATAANLLRGIADQPSTQVHADLAHALRRSGQSAAAWRVLDGALKRFAAAPRGALVREARACLRGQPSPYVGFAGITPSMRLYAESTSQDGRVTFQLHDAAGQTLAQESASLLIKPLPTGLEFIRVVADGQPLLGGDQELPPDFAIDGRVLEVRARSLRGWVRVGWNVISKPRLNAHDSGRRLRASVTGPLDDGRWEFEVGLDSAAARSASVQIDVRLPDGSVRPLPDSPLIPNLAASSRPRKPARRRTRQMPNTTRPLDVIIPVYRDHERTLTCIRSVCDTAEGQVATILVIDDASPEPALSADLDALAAAGDITLLRNERNLGFAASVNRAMAVNPAHDAILLNSDVVVFDGWLSRLREAAYRDPVVGSATPLSDDDSVVGYATADGDVAAAEEYDRICAQRGTAQTVELPVGVGFCLYIRRDCWAETGEFDHAAFPRGYGEEADWCMRARKLGWRHVLADRVFVHHTGSRSFGAARPALLQRSARLLNLRHPGYDARVLRFLQRDPVGAVRRDLDIARLRSVSQRFVLLTTLALPGGVDRAIAERARQIRSDGRETLVLQPVNRDDMRECRLRCDALDLRHLRFSIPRELPALRTLLESLSLESIEIHHTLGLEPRVVEMLRGLGAPVDAHLHDYALVCPRVTMIGSSGSYCGEPALSTCEACVRRNGSNIPEHISVRQLRSRSARWLATMRRVVAPSADAAARMGRYFPDLQVEVVPNEVFVAAGRRPPIRRSQTILVAVIGAIGRHKGFEVLLACARDAARRKVPIEFVVIGYTQDDRKLMRTGRVHVTGAYRDEELGYLLGREAPQVMFLPSVWPETWCYTLSHAIASGLPVAAFDIGAMGERLRQEPTGTLFPIGLPPREINRRLIELGRDAMGSETSTMTSAVPASAGRLRSAGNVWKQG